MVELRDPCPKCGDTRADFWRTERVVSVLVRYYVCRTCMTPSLDVETVTESRRLHWTCADRLNRRDPTSA